MNWQWLEVCVEVPGGEAEALAGSLEDLCATRAVIEETPNRCCVRIYLPQGPSLVHTAEEINRFLDEHFPHLWPQARPLKEQEWAEGWKAFFTPQSVGQRLVIKPPWAEAAEAGRIIVEIDPGPAFGTGQHPTTRLCLRELEAHLHPGMAVLDLGAGSGILAIAAAKMGAERVLALDTDPVAVKAARQNIALNQVGERVEVKWGGLEACTESFDLALVNISSEAIIGMAAGLRGVVGPEGILIASGFIADNLEGVIAALRGAGWGVGEVAQEEEWRAVVARKE